MKKGIRTRILISLLNILGKLTCKGKSGPWLKDQSYKGGSVLAESEICSEILPFLCPAEAHQRGQAAQESHMNTTICYTHRE